jgi:hypothetical protein
MSFPLEFFTVAIKLLEESREATTTILEQVMNFLSVVLAKNYQAYVRSFPQDPNIILYTHLLAISGAFGGVADIAQTVTVLSADPIIGTSFQEFLRVTPLFEQSLVQA